MKFGKKTILALALVAANLTPIAQACDANDRHHHHHLHDEHTCAENFPNGLSDEINGRRTGSRFRVGDHNWGSREAFEDSGARCMSSKPSRRQVEQSDDILNKWRKRSGSNRRLDSAAKPIPVYFHVIKQENGNGGIVTDAQIAEQISVLNFSFENAFKFTLAGNTQTKNDSYYAAGISTNEEVQMKSSRQGGANALNIYSSAPVGGVLAWATYPNRVKSSSGNINSNDGIVLRFDTLPGGDLYPYNGGRTLVHEVGHWLGLFHTFQGGCDGAGDRVSDTNSEASPAYGCPVGRNVSTPVLSGPKSVALSMSL